MKLGTKILMGFATTGVIFLILTVYIFILLRGVQTDSQELAETILPTSIASSDVLARMGMMAYYVNDYFYSFDASLDPAKKENDFIEEQFQIMKENFNAPAIQRSPELMASITSLFKTYAAFYATVLAIDSDYVALIAERVTVQDNYNDMVKLCTEVLATQKVRLFNAAYAGDIELMESIYEMVEATHTIRESLDTNMTALMQGQQRRNRTYFDDAEKAIAIMLERAQWLESSAVTPEDTRMASEMSEIAARTLEHGKALADAVFSSVEKNDQRMIFRDLAMKDSKDVSAFTDHQSLTGLSVANEQLNAVIWSLIIGVAVSIIISVVLGTIIIRGITKPVNMFVETLSEGATQVDNTSSQLTTASNILAEGATANAASLEETSAALEELASMSKRNADNSFEANAFMNQASEAVQQADSSMVDVIRAMEEISISGNEIGKIIKTIDEIAFQTNLLALNAAVEAARAGEAGAGFAVVADEVRNLAIRSADAAKNTSDLIASTISNINSGTVMVNTTADNFKVVAERSGKIAELLSDISEASKEQSQGISQITTAMTDMDKVTQSNAATAEQSASAATELSHQAGNLLEAVDGLNALVHGQGQSQGKVNNHQPLKRIATRAKALPRSKSAKQGDDFNLDDNFDF